MIDLDRDQEPIRGSLPEPERHATTFQGWLALVTLIESTRRAESDLPGEVCGD